MGGVIVLNTIRNRQEGFHGQVALSGGSFETAGSFAKGSKCSRLTCVRLQATPPRVKIRNFVHKGLKGLYSYDGRKGVPPDTVDKLRRMLAFLDDMDGSEELRALPMWKAHTLTGDRKGIWSPSVTRNRRLTFRIDAVEHEICDVNLEDSH
jgi:toxin HigB-1